MNAQINYNSHKHTCALNNANLDNRLLIRYIHVIPFARLREFILNHILQKFNKLSSGGTGRSVVFSLSHDLKVLPYFMDSSLRISRYDLMSWHILSDTNLF